MSFMKRMLEAGHSPYGIYGSGQLINRRRSNRSQQFFLKSRSKGRARTVSQHAQLATFEIVGDKELIRKFEKLRQSTVNKIMRPAISAAIRPIRKAAKQYAPKRFGVLRKSIRTRTFTNKGRVASVTGAIFVDKKIDAYINGKRVYPVKYAHLAAKSYMEKQNKQQDFIKQARDDKMPESQQALASRARIEFDKVVRGLR